MSLTTHQNFDKIWNNPNIGKQYHAAEMVTLVFARELVAQSRIVSVPIDTPLSVLDQACGTGVVALALHEALTERTETSWSLTCTDMSQNMLDVLQERVEIAGWKNTDVKISDIQKNGLLSAQYSHVFSSFVVMALPDSNAALDESFRVLKPGGTFAITTWKNVFWLDDVNEVFDLLKVPRVSAAEFLNAMGKGEWDNPSYVEKQLRERGFADIQAAPIAKTIDMGSAQEFAAALQPPLQLIMSRFWTEEQRQESSAKISPTLIKYLEDTAGKGITVNRQPEAIVVTARKPLSGRRSHSGGEL